MHSLKFVAAAALMITPTLGLAQDNSPKIVPKQKSWLASNFRSFDCALVPGPTAALTGGGMVSFDGSGDGGVDLAVSLVDGGIPTITAHAIRTKGAGGVDRQMAPQSCLTADASSSSSAAACSVSGDVQSPTVRFTVPLSALGDPAAAKSDTGTVTTVMLIAAWASKKGYDYYRAQTDRSAAGVHHNPGPMVIATCDSSKLTVKGGKPMTATYDLAVAKK